MGKSRSVASTVKPGTPPGILKKPSAEKIKARMVKCRRSFKLNFSNLGMWEIPNKFIATAKYIGIKAIHEIILTRNLFELLPLDMGETKHMKVFILKFNRFKEFPRITFSFTKLQVLDLSNNFIQEIDMSLSTLTNMRDFDITNNLLTGPLPCFWTNMPNLTNLSIAKNKITAIPASIELAKSLMKLDISENEIASLPATLGKLSELVDFDIHTNKVTDVPSTAGYLNNLQRLECLGNPLSEPGFQLYLMGFYSFMGFLRTQFQEEQLESKAKERPIAQAFGLYSRYYTESEYKNWPMARTGHSITEAHHATFMFGGFIARYGKVDEFYSINHLTLIWGRPVTNGGPPSCRDGHAAAFDGTHRLYIFGGRNEEQKLLNDFYYIDLRSMSWVKPLLDGPEPHVREGASMVAIGDKIMIFGGRGDRQRFNDLYIVDAKTWKWNLQSTKGLRPTPRQNAAMVVEQNVMYIHGGKGDLICNDMYVMSTVNFIWIKVNQIGLEPRYGHTPKIMNNKFYVVGGTSANGAAKTSMFSMELPPIDNLEEVTSQQAMLLPLVEKMELQYHEEHRWVELETELSAKPVSSFCFHKELLLVVQNRGETEEQVIIEDYTDLLVWDVYLEARIESLQLKVLPPPKYIPPDVKSNRVADILADETKLRGLPRTYQYLTDADVRLHDHIQKWQKRFRQMYRDRRELEIVFPNEAGIPKFLSSTIRPSQLKYPEFFYWEGVAKFLPGFLKYEPLEDPVDFPKYIPSPLTILQWEKADSFDYSIVLVSLLLGVGYDAMCVCGYAPRDITTNNQKKVNFDIINVDPPPKKPPAETKPDKHDKNAPAAVVPPKNYEIIVQPKYNAEYLAKKKHDRLLLGQVFVADFVSSNTEEFIRGRTDDDDTLMDFMEYHYTPPPKKPDPPAPPPVDNSPPDPFAKRRLHCWVIMFKGDREVADTFYLEPTTGVRYAPDETPYQGIEFAWNSVNLWINMQENPQKEGIANVSWDLKNAKLWEPVLDVDLATPYVEDPSTDPAIAFGKVLEEPPAEAVQEPAATSKNAAATPKTAVPSKKEEVVEKDLRGDIDRCHWFLGLSWVPKLEIPIDNYFTRCPKGCKKTLYTHCAHLMFAFYGDYMRWDGLVERLVYFRDDNYKDLYECHDFYQRRKDMLQKRIYYLDEMKVQESFGAGTTTGIKMITAIEGAWRTFEYYPRARIDGLQTRHEIMGQQVKETYAGRDDSLIYRCVVYAPPLATQMEEAPGSIRSLDMSTIDMTTEASSSAGGSARGSARRGSVASKRSSLHRRKSIQGSVKRKDKLVQVKRGRRLPSVMDRLRQLLERKNQQMMSFVWRGSAADKLLSIVKITQKYSFVDDVKPSDNVIKRVFRIPIKQIRIDYHFVNGHITNNTKIYEKDGSYTSIHVDPFQDKMEGFAQKDEFRDLRTAEKEAIQAVREAEQDVIELLKHRASEESCVVLMTPFSDGVQVKEDDLPPEDTKVAVDYLSPHFPPGIKPRQHLTRPQMIVVRDNCMRALREKLVNRANIIQKHYDEDTALLAVKRANFERDREGMTVAQEEEYERNCEQAQLRIRILEERRAYHEDQSLKKYAEMSERLRNDPRLHLLYPATVQADE